MGISSATPTMSAYRASWLQLKFVCVSKIYVIAPTSGRANLEPRKRRASCRQGMLCFGARSLVIKVEDAINQDAIQLLTQHATVRFAYVPRVFLTAVLDEYDLLWRDVPDTIGQVNMTKLNNPHVQHPILQESLQHLS